MPLKGMTCPLLCCFRVIRRNPKTLAASMALTTQTATDLRGIRGNDRLKKCRKANEMERK